MSQNFEQTYLQLRRAVLEKHFSRMNDKQREAVFQTEGPVLILAGAGSGKTTVVVNRIANMVQFGNAYHSDYVPAWVGEEDLAFLQDWLDDKLDDGDITRERLTRIVADRPVRPWNILAITFTNKAAGELKERLEAMLGEQALDIQASMAMIPFMAFWLNTLNRLLTLKNPLTKMDASTKHTIQIGMIVCFDKTDLIFPIYAPFFLFVMISI